MGMGLEMYSCSNSSGQLNPSREHLLQLGAPLACLFLQRTVTFFVCPGSSALREILPFESSSYVAKAGWHHPHLHIQGSHPHIISKVYPNLGGEIRGVNLTS